MNEQTAQPPSGTRKLVDAALVIVAFAALASWAWRRLRRPADIGEQIPTSAALTGSEQGGSVGTMS